jgi:hypothetical protein
MRSALELVNASGTTARGSADRPRISALMWASSTKWRAVSATVGVPRFSTSIMSWTSHDVHDPQSPLLPITASHSAVIRSTSSGVACR